MRKLNIFLLIMLAVALQVAIVVGAYKIVQKPEVKQEAPKQVRVEQPKEPEYILDPYISQLADEVGIDKTELIKTKPYITSQKECGPNPDTLGCYGYRITIIDTVKTRDRYKQRVALAHEYLHYVWQHKTDQEAFKPQLMSIYLANKAYFTSRLSSYNMQVGDYQFYNELHSFVGTEVSDSKLPKELLDHYSKYTNRSALPSYI